MIRTILIYLSLFSLAHAGERPPVKCTEDSPERRGEEGCSILVSRPLVGSSANPLYWHIDRFDSLEAARKAAGPDGVAAEAHGSVWLMTVERQTEKHHGGTHVASLGPLPLVPADRYVMRVSSSLLAAGAISPVHTHSGPEAIYVVGGEYCLQTQQMAHRLAAGQSSVLPGDTIHRGRSTAPEARAALALVLHDASRPASSDLTDPPSLAPCK